LHEEKGEKKASKPRTENQKKQEFLRRFLLQQGERENSSPFSREAAAAKKGREEAYYLSF